MEEQSKKPRQYKKKKRTIVISNTDEEVRQALISFMSEFLCEEILSGRFAEFNKQNNEE